MAQPIIRTAILLLAALGAACTRAPEPQAPNVADTSPSGRIYHVVGGRFVEEPALMADLERADFVLLGERHDNAEHHRLQERLVRALQERWARPAPVAFEMMTTDQQLTVAEHLQRYPDDASQLGEALEWAQSGWPDWGMYAPIAQAALDADAQIVAANIPHSTLRAVFEGSTEPLGTAFLRRTGLGAPLPATLAAALRDELEAAHCGYAPPRVVDGMYRVQRARDARMAERLATLSGGRNGILIAGTGHVRKDRGVPWYLDWLRPESRTLSVAFVEANATPTELNTLPYDYVWFTASVDDGDPCARYSGSLETLEGG